MAEPVTVDKAMPATHPHRRAVKSIILIALAIMVIVVLIMLIIWLVLQPSKQSFILENAHVLSFNLSRQSINATFLLDLKTKNSNKRISIEYDAIAVSLWYDDQTIAFGSIPRFVQPRDGTTKLHPLVVADSTPLQVETWNEFSQQYSKHNELKNLQVRLMSEINFFTRKWKSKRYVLKVSCWINALPLGYLKGIDCTVCDVHYI